MSRSPQVESLPAGVDAKEEQAGLKLLLY